MSLYDAKSSADFYKIMKPYYLHNKQEFSRHTPVFTIIEPDDKRLNIVKESIRQTKNLDFSFVSSYLEKCKYYHHIYYQFLHVFIISAKPLSSKDKMKLYNTIIRIQTVMQLYNMQKPNNIYFIMNPMKRYLPSLPSKVPINTKHINGGFTYTSGNNIFIIREEEYEKVVIHELLHHNKYIHCDDYKQANINQLKQVFNLDDRYNLYPNEAVVEVFACLINTVFYTLDYNKGLKDFKTLLKKDCHHSLMITNKIIDRQKNKKWLEKTNTYSYCVFKTILYYHFDKFIKNFRHNDDTHISHFICKHAKHVLGIARKCPYIDRSLKLTLF
jgi:hypothetical protein